MSDQNFRTKETELAAEEVNELSSEEETQPTKKQARREKVFKACDELDQEGTKITRDTVLKLTGGSCRDIGGYIEEWRQSKSKSKNNTDNDNDNDDENENQNQSEGALVVQNKGSIEAQSHGEMAQQEEVQTLKARVVKRQVKTARSAGINSANRAAGVLVAEERGFQYLLENPDQLPEELKHEVEKAIKDSEEMMSERCTRFELSFFVEEALSSLHGKD